MEQVLQKNAFGFQVRHDDGDALVHEQGLHDGDHLGGSLKNHSDVDLALRPSNLHVLC